MRPERTQIYTRNMNTSPLGGIRIAGFAKDGAGLKQRLRSHSFYSFVYLLKGRGVYDDGRSVSAGIRPGDALLVMPGSEHWYGPCPGTTWDELYILFEGPVFDAWRTSGCFDWAPLIRLASVDSWSQRIVRTAGESHFDRWPGMMAESQRLEALFLDILSFSRAPVKSDQEWLIEAKAALSSRDPVSDAADNLGLPYHSFRRKFKKLAGIPPGKYKTAVVMDNACRLLANRSLSVREIASMLDYCDEYHFSKQFRRTVGWSPSDYRSRINPEHDDPPASQRH